MQLQMELPEQTMQQIKTAMLESAKKAYAEAGKQKQFGAYLTKEEASKYLHVSRATLNVFIDAGLKVMVFGNIQRISKNECDRFMVEHQI
jgi:hypothetical protein